MPQNPLVSFVIPVYNDHGSLGELQRQLAIVSDSLAPARSEFVYVDDGSADGSVDALRQLVDQDPRVRAVILSRNFGQQAALLAGFSEADGDVLISLDSDLQDPPDVAIRMFEQWLRGSKIVFGRRRRLHTPRWRRVTSFAYYRLLRALSDIPPPIDCAEYRLLDRACVDALLQVRDRTLYLRGLAAWIGYPSAIVEYDSQPRYAGQSGFTPGRLLRFAWAGFVSTAGRLPGAIAVVSLTLGLACLVYAAVLADGDDGVPQFVWLVAFAWSFAVAAFILLYLNAVLVEARARPRYFVQEVIGSPLGNADA